MVTTIHRRRWKRSRGFLGPLVGLLLAGALGAAPVLRAEEEPPVPVPTGEGAPAGARQEAVAVIRGHDVNVRVGPRVDVRPVTRLDDGAVLLIVERVPGWYGVRIPAGFVAVVSAQYVEPAGADAVRVKAHRLNLRLHPPQEGRPLPGAFRDRATYGALLPLVRREGEWVWVVAPESVRAYVSAEYVRELGPAGRHGELVSRAREARRAWLERIAAERRERAALLSGERLRGAIGAAQQALYRLRLEGGWERAPVVGVANALDRALEAGRAAPVAVRKLAHAMRQDLEAEMELRMARKDAEVARLRGLDPPAGEPSSRGEAEIVVRGEIRWEPAPTWRNGGAYVLWVEGEPAHVLRLTTGMPLPMPDLKAHAGAGRRTIAGRVPGDRVFGLPVIEVRAIKE